MVYFKGQAAERGQPAIDPKDITRVAEAFDLEPALLSAVIEVECRGKGFFDDGRLVLLFEAHRFAKYTGGRYNSAHPNISSARWNRDLYWGGPAEYTRLGHAMALDEEAALKSASWGFPQMMGDEHRRAGFPDVETMICAFADSVYMQILSMAKFCVSKKLIRHLKACDWHRFAKGYNGRSYARNRYHLKMAIAFAAKSGLTSIGLGSRNETVRQLQIALQASGYAPGAADGAMGPRTAGELVTFQRDTRSPFPGGLS